MSSNSILILILAKFIYDYIEIIPALHYIKNENENYSLILEWKMIAGILTIGPKMQRLAKQITKQSCRRKGLSKSNPLPRQLMR